MEKKAQIYHMNIIQTLLAKHHELDFAIRDRKGKVFYSDWNCCHPFVDEYLGGMDCGLTVESGINQYKFYEDCENITFKIANFHKKIEGLHYSGNSLFAGDGSTPLIYSYCMWLFDNKITELFYVPPLYYNFYYFAKVLGIRVRPVSYRHPFEKDFEMNLPVKKCNLVLTDPVWYAGISVKKEFVDQLTQWQEQTGSIIFVDGSFQYSRWDGIHLEHTASLDPENTFRLICPTKALAIHGFRFSYLLMPSRFRDAIRYIFANSHGPTTAHNIRFAEQAMMVLDSEKSNRKLTNFIADIYRKLIDQGYMNSELSPDSGYFIFANLNQELSHEQILMDGDFFEQCRFESYSRINLLAPDTLNVLLNLNF